MKTHTNMPSSANTKKPHVHAELIKAWAENTTLKFQCRFPEPSRDWVDCQISSPNWTESLEYRIKPEPKPDVVRYARAACYEYDDYFETKYTTYWTSFRSGQDNLKATFNGETGELKFVEILK